MFYFKKKGILILTYNNMLVCPGVGIDDECKYVVVICVCEMDDMRNTQISKSKHTISNES